MKIIIDTKEILYMDSEIIDFLISLLMTERENRKRELKKDGSIKT